MAKYFLGSVGTAEAFRRNASGELELAFVSKTLTDSGLNISTTKDDIRAGTGAPIQFSFYHDPSVEITLTDVIFDHAYIEAQLGANFETGGNAYDDEKKTSNENSQVTLSELPVSINMGCGEKESVVWYRENVADAEWAILPENKINGKVLTMPKASTEYCIRYVRYNADAKIAEIKSTIIPQELFLVITAPIFAGDACSASNGKKAGTITYEVPRFKLNGAQEFSMNMSSNQTMSLAGVALASNTSCDITDSQLLRIITVISNEHWYTDVTELIADEDCLKVDEVPAIYALHKNGTVSLIDNDYLTFAPALNSDGAFSEAGSTTITVKLAEGDTSTPLTDTFVVAQGE